MTRLDTLVRAPVDLTGYRLGDPQRAGVLTMVPIHGPERPGIVPPRSGLKLKQVVGYGSVELRNPAPAGVAIVPLHIGYIQEGAQNHALCSAALLGAGETRRFDDACCVQAAQGGYLEGRDQWFFVLPLELRAQALALRGQPGYSKLWQDITVLNARYRLPARGHLEQILTRERAVLTQFRNRLELLPGQLGALFFLGERFAGLEIAPDPRYFAEMWMPLVCFAYGVSAWHEHRPLPATQALEAGDIAGLRAELASSRARQRDEVLSWMPPASGLNSKDEESYLDLHLSTVYGEGITGQLVREHERLVYASIFPVDWVPGRW